MKVPISVCIIARNEERTIEKCLLSIRDYVDEIVLIDTGSIDKTPEIAKKYVDKFEIYTACNDEQGRILDFSQARNYSISLAKNDYIMWIDSDDEVLGAENIPKLFEQALQSSKGQPFCLMFPYYYSFDSFGNPTLIHYRERIMGPKNLFTFVNPVHEVIQPLNGVVPIGTTSDEVIIAHRRGIKLSEPGRNLRILKEVYKKQGESDARQLYYLGLELGNNGEIDESIKIFNRYIELSGWDDEKYMACINLCTHYMNRSELDKTITTAFQAISFKEQWGEAYFILAKCFYLKALISNNYRDWERCANFAKQGLSFPPTKTLLFVNPLIREFEIHQYLNMALSHLGDLQGALDSVNTALKKFPNDANMLFNKKFYEFSLNKHQFNLIMDKFRNEDHISSLIYNNVHSAFNNKDIEIIKNIFPIWTIIEGLRKTGIEPKDCYLQNNELKITKGKKATKLDIIFYAGAGLEHWNPCTIKNTGIGGSELIMYEIAKRLSKFGHKVTIYNDCGSEGEGIFDGVEYKTYDRYKDLECDVLIVSRRAFALGDEFNIKAKLKVIWAHDIFVLNATSKLLLKADRILALSNWHKDFLINYHTIHPNQILVTRNGIDLKRFEKKIKRDQFKVVCSSSPDRYLPIMLEIWPEIKKQVPQASFHIYYGFGNWRKSAQLQNDQNQLNLIVALENKIQEMKKYDVVFHDRINQDQLAEEFLSAGVWGYSNHFEETYCISAAEASAAGLRLICNGNAALKETVGDRGHLIINKDWTSPEFKKEFIEATVQALQKEDDSDRLGLQKYAKENFGLKSLAKNWEKMFYDLIEKMKTNPIVPYQPTKEYQL